MSTPYNTPTSYGAGSNASQSTEAPDVAALAETARQDLSGLGDEVKEQVSGIADEVKSQIGDVAEKAKGLAAEQKDLLAEQVGGVVDAVGKVADELEGNQSSSAAYVRMIADGAQKLSSTLKDNDVDDILAMAQDFGRKQPVAFMGAAALLGFAASRFVLASAKRQVDTPAPVASTSSSSYGESYNGGNDAGI